MRMGPTTQFCTSERPSTRLLRNTSGSSSYRTFVNGGYIITISPMAIGMDVVPTLNRLRNGTTPGASHPAQTPMIMAAKIQTVRYRSRKLSRLGEQTGRELFVANAVNLLFQGKCIKALHRQAE